jgi:glycosyltransferase involved in cell wall biosynthesis
MTHITSLVSNDLSHDQRVKKQCATLTSMGFSMTLVGRKRANSVPLDRPYKTRRFKLLFSTGALFYAALNIRLFFYLLLAKTDLILANDLDTLLPAILVGKLRNKKVVYDSHEYFTEAAGLTGRSFQKKVWLKVEKYAFRSADQAYTVNKSIADIYTEKYNRPVEIIRNIPPSNEPVQGVDKSALGLPDKHIILLQGAYIDHDRGALEAAQAMKFVENALLLIIGDGQEIGAVKELVSREGLEEKVKLMPKMPFDELRKYTAVADLGLSLDKPIHLNYKLSLPNKLFDYIHAGLPVLTSALPELVRIQEKYEIGLTIEHHDPEHIAQKMQQALGSEKRETWKANLKEASKEYTWENEAEKLKEIYSRYLS